MNQINMHLAIKKLVEVGVLIPGVFDGTVGNITYSPISIEEFAEKIENEDVANLAYNTRTMGRGIFVFGENGEIVNYKGVDSQLKNSDSIAVQITEGEIENVNGQDSYGINIIHFVDRSTRSALPEKRLEFRVKGASQFQNLFAEKLKNDDIRRRDRRGIIKVPHIDFPSPLSSEMCEKFDLPRVVEVKDEFLKTLNPNSYGGYCLSQMKQNQIPFADRNQLWREYFTKYHREKLSNEELMKVVDAEDSKYGLGATFGQTVRKLENPFRIMELQYYIRHNDIDALNAILDFTTQGKADFMNDYAAISARNAAGFMNLKLAMNNFEHRQDYPLSGEICDDAFDDVSKYLFKINPSEDDKPKIDMFNLQVFIFATNMKIMEDAYRLTGREVPSDYKKHFVEIFYDSLEDKSYFKTCFQRKNVMQEISRFDNAEKNFRGMESYMQEIIQIAAEVYMEKNATKDVPNAKPEKNDMDID